MSRLILIRHGETDYNAQHRYCGFSDPPLNNKGIIQSKRLQVIFKDIEIDKIYSSDLKRAYESASIIFKSNQIEKTPEFREMNFGNFEGLKYEQLLQKYPQLYREWINNPLEVKIPHGESLKDLSKRVKEKIFFILHHYPGKTIAVVTHAGPIRIILTDILGFNFKSFWQVEQDIAAYNVIDYSQRLKPCLVKMNETSYLSTKEKIAL